MIFENLNYLTLAVFAPVLVLVGILGFIVPTRKALTSGAPAYNLFHIFFGIVGALIVFGGNHPAIRSFNLIFGLIDLYQAAASRTGWFPKALIRWTRIDDLLHLIIGAILVAISIFGR